MRCLRCPMDSRVILLSSCILLFFATTSAAQFLYVGTIRLFCDSLYTCTETDDTVPGILTVYVVHDPEGGEIYDWHTAAQFMVSGGGGFTGTWLADTSPYPRLIGTSPTGISILYDTCAPPGHLLTIRYMMWGTSTPDSYLEVLPHPDEPMKLILVYPCTGFANYCDGGRLTINPSGVPTESTTWGRIKEMYE